MMCWIIIHVQICCCHIIRSKNHNWSSLFHYLVSIHHHHNTGWMAICSIYMWEFWSQLIIMSLPHLKDSLSTKAKLVSSIPHQFPTNLYMHHYSILFVHYHKSSKTNYKISLLKINLMKVTNFYYFSKQTISTDGNRKSNMNIHGTLKSQCLSIWKN